MVFRQAHEGALYLFRHSGRKISLAFQPKLGWTLHSPET